MRNKDQNKKKNDEKRLHHHHHLAIEADAEGRNMTRLQSYQQYALCSVRL